MQHIRSHYGLHDNIQLILARSTREQVSLDFVTGLPRTTREHDSIIVFVDRLTKMVHLAPTTTTVTARGTARLLFDNVFKHHGMPAALISDRDARFVSSLWHSLMSLLGTKLKMSTSFHTRQTGKPSAPTAPWRTTSAVSEMTTSQTGMSCSQQLSSR